MRVLVTGVQGSGKTTQANLVAEKLGWSLVKTGDILRKFAQEEGEENKETLELLEKGVLVDNQLLARLIRAKFEELQDSPGVVADGYPRRMSQMECFDPGYDLVFNLDIPDEVGVERLLNRGRADDTPDAIQERLKWYHQETKPVLEYYQRKGILIDIDGEKEIDDVTEEILAHLKKEPSSETQN